jgi:hypothetical protein
MIIITSLPDLVSRPLSHTSNNTIATGTMTDYDATTFLPAGRREK